MSAMQKQLQLQPCDNQRERCSALRNPPILPRSLSTPGIPAGNTFSIHPQYSNAMTNDQQVSYPHAASPSIFHYDTRVTNTPNSLGLDGDFQDQSFYGDANLYRHSSTPSLQRRSYSSEDYKMSGMGHSARDLSTIDSPQNFRQTNSPESFYRISKSQVIHNDTLDHESYNNRGSLLDFGNHCANSGGSDFAPRSTATQAHLHEIDKHGISRLSSSEVNGSGNQQTPSVITKLDNSINFRYEQSAYENEKTDPQITNPSKIVVEKNGKTYTNLNTSQNLPDTLGHSEQNLSGPVSNKTNGIPPMEEHLLKEPESTTITAADQDIVRANSSLHADWSSRARSYALDKDGEDGNSTFQRSETDEWEDSSEEGSSSDEENSEKENIERVGRAVARCLPGPVPRAVLQYHAIFSAALKYKSEEMKSATRRQLFKSPTLPQTYYEPSDKMKEIFPGSGFYMHEHKISYMENMADDNGVFNWKILVIEVLTEIYKSNLKNYCARGQSGCGRPGICKRLYTGLYKWARSSVQKEGKVLSTKEFTAFINKSTSNRRKDSSKEKSQFSTEENSGG